MPRLRPRRLALAGLLATAAIAAITVPAAGDQPPDRSTDAAAHRASAASTSTTRLTFTLVTGDKVAVRSGPDGITSAEVEPAPGRTGMLFQKIVDGDKHFVLPLDAARLVATKVVDQRLFDIAFLAEHGLDDASTPELPLLVQHTGQARTVQAALPPGTTVKREVPLAGAVALRQDRRKANELWRSWTSTARAERAIGLAGTVTKLWLDGGVKPLLDRSAAQIGAPTAWQNGVTGKGVKVAVLDSGYDAGHPDLTDRVVAAKAFTSDGTGTADRNGHGTHVASTLGGSGAATGGKYRGIAPDADLLIGKVCGDGGCEISDVIAGMEWAAAEGARVVNLSLGGDPSDGTDPLSVALNELTAKTGTLFVVAAGNYGSNRTVALPAAADAALAVSSVTKSDTLSTFSSRGPRIGDLAIKPELAAPGDQIVAARASGAPLDDVAVGKWSAQLSGTSMAAPHVAGAATLLAQLHPTWKAPELKAALINSAQLLPGIAVSGQGGGRVDVARAIRQPVIALPGTLDLGLQSFPHHDDKPVTKTVTYRNDGTEPVRLELTLRATGPDGRPSTIIRLNRSSVLVPARGTATVDVTADTSGAGPDGLYTGRLVATGPGSTVATTIGVGKEVESFDKLVTVLDRSGQPVIDGDERAAFAYLKEHDSRWATFIPAGQSYRVARGKYILDAGLGVVNPGGQGYLEGTYFGEPELIVDNADPLVLDSRKAKEIEMKPPVPGIDPAAAGVGSALQLDDGRTLVGGIATLSLLAPGTSPKLFVTPARTDETGTFTTYAHAAWADLPNDPELGKFRNSPHVYHDVAVWPGKLPEKLSLVTPRTDYAHLDASYAGEPGTIANNYGYPTLPGLYGGGRRAGAFVYTPAVEMDLPFRRQEYYAVGGAAKGITWSFQTEVFRMLPDNEPEYLSLVDSQPQSYPAGRTTPVRWQQAVFGPSLPDNRAGKPLRDPWPFVGRRGDSLEVNVPLHSDGGADRLGLALVDSEQTTLTRDGVEIGTSEGVGFQTFRLAPGDARYTLTKKAVRSAERYKLSTEITAAWTFRSRRARDDQPAPLPLMTFRFQPDLDNRNTAPAGQFEVPFVVEHQYGSKARPVTTVTVEASFDDMTWKPVPVRRAARGWIATVDQPGGTAVALRAKAVDAGGNEVEQTIQRAYLVR